MRKLLTLFGIALITLTASAHTYVNGFCTDDGCTDIYEPATSVNGYYEINNGGKLFWFAQQVNAGTGKFWNAKLTANIDLDGDNHTWTPMGTSSKQFAGEFDGQGYSITNLKVNVGTDVKYAGFIGYHSGNYDIKNFNISGSLIVSGTTSGHYAAGVIAYSTGNHRIEDIHCSVNITLPESASAISTRSAGIVVGAANCTINRCVYDGIINGYTTNLQVGGILGWADGDNVVVTNCLFVGELNSTGTGNNSAYLGGIMGYSGNSRVGLDCSNNLSIGTINSPSEATRSGAIVGVNKYSKSLYVNNYILAGQLITGSETGSSKTPSVTEVTAANLTSGTLPESLGAHSWIQSPTYPIPQLNHEHSYNNGICIHGDAYQPATKEGEYYLIENAGTLIWLERQINKGVGSNYNAKLTADIDLENRLWTPMGSETYKYTGEFDGQGYSITGLNVNTNAQYTAFIGYHDGTTSVHDFSLAGSVTYTGNTADHCVAGVIAINAGVNTVEDIVCSVNIETPKATADVRIAGIVAREESAGTINRCTYSGTNNGYGTAMQVAGIVGMAGTSGNNMKVTNCLFTGTLKATNTGAYVGGIAGYIGKSGTSFKNCLSAGSYEVPSGATHTGALIGAGNGYVTATTFDNCYILTGQPEKGTNSGISATISYTEATATTLADGTVTNGLGDNWAQDTGNPVPKAFTCTESNGGAVATITGTVCAYNFDVFKNAVKDYATVYMRDANVTTTIEQDDIDDMLINNALVYVPDNTPYCGKNIVNDGICDDFELVEGKPFAPVASFDASAATYKRTVSNVWGTICLPYEVKSDANVTYYTSGTISGTGSEAVLTLTSADEVPAGTPAICKFAATGENTINSSPSSPTANVCISVAADTQDDDITLIGSFTEQTVSGSNVYAISSNQFWKVGASVTIRPFRAYFTTNKSLSNGFSIAVDDDDVTAIQALIGEGDTTIVAIYAADGKQISDLQKGLNIVKLSNGNTKKIILN